jgi:hypothetical protein
MGLGAEVDMARMMMLLLLSFAGCDDETTAFSLDLYGHYDLSASSSICPNAMTGVACTTRSTDWCQPDPNDLELICACAYPAHELYCCTPSSWSCPPSPRTGDFCCPLPSGMRTCGSCTCVQNQFICDSDGGARD